MRNPTRRIRKKQLAWKKSREGARSALWQAQDDHAGLQFDIQRGVLTDNLYVLTVYPLDDSTAAPLGTKSASTMAEVKRKAEWYRKEYRLGRLLNPTDYETYSLVIDPEATLYQEVRRTKAHSWRAALAALESTKILNNYDVQYGERASPIYVNEVPFAKFRKLVSALQAGFEGWVEVEGEFAIEYGEKS